ncbi:hypothetical protein SAMN02745194_03894 [Roseomonas rosea]|jgi:hypothetical protein|uniref:Uncharacterized protein n=1 Tax=Muricoccus roseus TaxID=198092 RepID=A0A1M6NSU7_9PROT|nr:hypothetical protein [Roseomonas rosea]SHJ98766.1 hypothetical protein SAMN02745194_03894 [Roseomonas rosea]
MRVPLPGRDYFPPRVLLRGAPRPLLESPRPDSRSGLMTMSAGSMALPAMPASPPAPAASLRPAAA